MQFVAIAHEVIDDIAAVAEKIHDVCELVRVLKTNGMAECRDLHSGEIVWRERLRGTGADDSTMSSPVLAGDRLYVPNQNADVFVLRAGPKFELLAVNSIGGEPMIASLAVSNGDIFIRTDKSLRCIGPPRR